MGRIGIEHDGIPTVLQAYRHWEQPNYAIYAGKEQRDSYEGGNMEEGETNLSDWLQMIQGNGTTGVYTLRVYPETEKEITTKTPHKGSTTFCLNSPDSGRRGGDGVVVVDNTRNVGSAAPANNNLLMQLLESNNKMIGAVTAAMSQQKDDKIDKLINMLLEERNKPPVEEPPHWLEKMALVVAEKPEIIDKIGYLFRPNLYTHEQPINGTKTEPVAQPKATEAAPLTAEQTEVLNERLYTALDNMARRYGLVAVTEMMEKVAAMSDFKINAMKAFL